MKIIRRNTFETNSSSTHSITMCSGETYDKWKNGELYFIETDEKFVDETEQLKYAKEIIIKNSIRDCSTKGTLTYNDVTITYEKDNWQDRHNKIKSFLTPENINAISDEEAEECLEELPYYERPLGWQEYFDYAECDFDSFLDSYTTNNGDRVVAFGYYGYN